jgi:hypothetical protein
MATNIKGTWTMETLHSDYDEAQPCIGILLRIDAQHMSKMHPVGVKALIYSAAEELARILAVQFFDESFAIDVDKGFHHSDGSVMCCIRIDWPPSGFQWESFAAFTPVVSQYVQHLNEEHRHNTIVSLKTVEEGVAMFSDPTNDRVICVQGQDTEDSEPPDPEVNARPAPGTN